MSCPVRAFFSFCNKTGLPINFHFSFLHHLLFVTLGKLPTFSVLLFPHLENSQPHGVLAVRTKGVLFKLITLINKLTTFKETVQEEGKKVLTLLQGRALKKEDPNYNPNTEDSLSAAGLTHSRTNGYVRNIVCFPSLNQLSSYVPQPFLSTHPSVGPGAASTSRLL